MKDNEEHNLKTPLDAADYNDLVNQPCSNGSDSHNSATDSAHENTEQSTENCANFLVDSSVNNEQNSATATIIRTENFISEENIASSSPVNDNFADINLDQFPINVKRLLEKEPHERTVYYNIRSDRIKKKPNNILVTMSQKSYLT
ncbi:unnamed protein product [Rotaria sp. Silwood2]|nr:unnamed protein product [Rotaria sp. Silwood2]CAF4292348.1 unnamed protein product [Rotaria sp. Silwood2]